MIGPQWGTICVIIRQKLYFEKIVLLWDSFLEIEYSFVVLGSLVASFILRILFIGLKDCII